MTANNIAVSPGKIKQRGKKMTTTTANLYEIFNRGQVTELAPNDSRKSFYGNAKMSCIDGLRILKSYETIVAYYDRNGALHRTWGKWSATTGRHLSSFAGINKAAWDKMPVEE